MSAAPSNEDLPKRDADPMILFAIREGIGQWDASMGQVVERVLIMRRAERPRRCCGTDLPLVADARYGAMTWELRRCLRCQREYEIGPPLPATWVSALSRVCIDLYVDFQAAVAAQRLIERSR